MNRPRRLALVLAPLLVSLAFFGCAGPHPTAPDGSAVPPGAGVAPDAQALIQDAPTGALAPALAPGLAFYPLEIGNRWHYARRFAYRIFDGTDPDPAPVVVRSTVERELTCEEELLGRTYVIETYVIRLEGGGVFPGNIAFRQDRSGLYETDGPPPPCAPSQVASAMAPGAERMPAMPAAGVPADARESAWTALERTLPLGAERAAYRAAWERLRVRSEWIERALGRSPGEAAEGLMRRGGPQPGEITRLRYPLHPGARWVIRPSPLFAGLVERLDVLQLPVGRKLGFRIRITSDLFGPNDRVHVWYGPSGYLRLEAHLESEATDINGNPLGLMVSEQSEVLDGIRIAGHRP